MKPKSFQWKSFVQVECFPIEHTWKNWTYCGWRKIYSKFYEIQNWFRFLAFSESNDPKKTFFSRMIFEVHIWCLNDKQTNGAKNTDGQKLKRTSTDFFCSFSFKVFSISRKLWKLLRGAICFRYVGKRKKELFIRNFSFLSRKWIFADNGVQTPYSRLF